MMERQENNLKNNKETQENVNLVEKAKRTLIKHKDKIIIGVGVILLIGTNAATAKVIGDKSFNEGINKGINKGINMVMNNPSMLGKGLNAVKKRIE